MDASSIADVFRQVLGDSSADAEKLFKGEPETALIAAILWAFEASRRRVFVCPPVGTAPCFLVTCLRVGLWRRAYLRGGTRRGSKCRVG